MGSKKNLDDILWDVVVIGGGPAGMMAAIIAAERGRTVLLIEKNPALGRKLLLTGGGRCNLTNNISDIRAMSAKYKTGGKFLFSAFSRFGAAETIEFFNSRGLATKEESEGRVFPVLDSAQSVLDMLIRMMEKSKVEIMVNSTVGDIALGAKKKHFNIRIKDGKEIKAKSCVIAAGGMAFPAAGSTGDSFRWLKNIGHTVVESDLALVPIALKDAWVKKISGVALENAGLSVYQNGLKQSVRKGNLLFAHFGITGPMVLNMSGEIGRALKQGEVVIFLDLFPELDQATLKKKFQELFALESNKKLKNTLSAFFPAAFVSALLELAEIDIETFNHSLKKEDRGKLISLLKNIPLNVKGLLGADKANASFGGVELKEVDFKTMQSRIAPNLYIVGDALDIDRPSGGYSLQICWTTGFVAGSNC